MTAPTAAGTAAVVTDVLLERYRQNAKWGEQNHPDGTGPERHLLAHTGINLDLRTGTELANIFRARCQRNTPEGNDNWLHILLEEVFEAGAEQHPAALRAELIQIAAVVVAWAECIDRRSAA